MAINATYKRYNGTSWDIVYFKTSAGQVGETSNLVFLRPNSHTVNGKTFFNGTTHQGITLYATDIPYISGSDETIQERIQGIEQTLDEGLTGDYLPLSGGTVDGDVDITGSLSVGLENNGFIATESIYLGPADDICLDYINKSGYGNVLRISSNIALTHNMLGKYDSNLGFGIASLGTDGKVPASQLPSYVDDIVEGYLQTNGEFWLDKSASSSNVATLYPNDLTGKIYVDIDTGITYRYGGESSGFVEISSSLALGTTSSTAFAGDRGLALEQWRDTTVPNTYLKIADYTAYELPEATATALGGVMISTSQQDIDGAQDLDTSVPTVYAVKEYVSNEISAIHNIYYVTASSSVTGMKTGDICLEYTA